MMTTMTEDDVTEVRRAKRSWPAQYKLDILTEIEAAKDCDAITVAEICRREGLYSSLISEWRKQRDVGALEGLRDGKAGRPKKDPAKAELARLRSRVAALEQDLGTAKELIEAQGKVSALLQQMCRKSAVGNNEKP